MSKDSTKVDQIGKPEDKGRDYTNERTAALAEAEAAFQEKVKEAAAEFKEVKKQYPDVNNIAEIAWNDTKQESDVEYDEVIPSYRQKLDAAVATIRATGNAGIAGLEAFEARVLELLKEYGDKIGEGALQPGGPGRPQEADESVVDTGEGEGEPETASAKRGKLPEDFPHREELEAAGLDTYAKVRRLGGDYTEVPGIGPSKGKDIDAAL